MNKGDKVLRKHGYDIRQGTIIRVIGNKVEVQWRTGNWNMRARYTRVRLENLIPYSEEAILNKLKKAKLRGMDIKAARAIVEEKEMIARLQKEIL